MINYPNKKKVFIETNKKEEAKSKVINAANRGMDFEKAVNSSNDFYRDQNLCLINKRPTPIKVVKVNYSTMMIKEAYFEKESTTDYNGVYKGKYIDFECKETKSTTSLSFANISSHQVRHIDKVIEHGGIAFFLIYFKTLDEVYLVDGKEITSRYNKIDGRKSITLEEVRDIGYLVEQGFIPRIKYLDVIEKVYFS